jgi:transcriptional regulator with XRE-family HTH domain
MPIKKQTEESPGAVVKRLRLAQGRTAYELAKAAKVAPAVVYRLESGEREPSVKTLRSLFRALGASLGLLDLPAK